MEQDELLIRELLSEYEKSLNTSDSKRAVELYTDNGIFMPTEAPTARGKEQLLGSYDWVFNTIKLSVKFTIEDIRVHGDAAFARTSSRGTVTILAEKKVVAEENREFFFFEKVGSAWKISNYMFNKDKPTHA